MPALDETVEQALRPAAAPASRRARTPLSRSHLRTALAAALGAGLGAAYAYFVGCRTGTCPLTSSVWTAALYGGIVGALAGWPSRAR
jgi:Family of unknown function (DUF6132)